MKHNVNIAEQSCCGECQFSHLCSVSVNGSTYRKWHMTLPQIACLYR